MSQMNRIPIPEVVPDCIYCRSHGVEKKAAMAFGLPTPDGELNIALCVRHFEELRDTLNAVYNEAHPKKKLIRLPPGLSMN